MNQRLIRVSVLANLILSASVAYCYDNIRVVTNIAALKNVSCLSANNVVMAAGYLMPNDGGGGLFTWDVNSTAIADNGTIFISNRAVTGRWVRTPEDASIINVKWFGVVGDGTIDDTSKVQTAIDAARSHKLTLYFPQGNYKISSTLDFTRWDGLAVRGSGTGSAPAAGSQAITKLSFNNISSIGADFSGSNNGKISDIVFNNTGTFPKATILIAMTSSGDGNNLVFDNCGIARGTTAGAFIYRARGTVFANCRLHCSGSGCHAIVMTGKTDYGISSEFQTFTSEGIVSRVSLFGGEIVGDNTSLVLLDGRASGGLDSFSMHGGFMQIAGSNLYGFEAIGTCSNISYTGPRCEIVNFGSNIAFGLLKNGCSLYNLFLVGHITTGDSIDGTGNIYSSFIQTWSGDVNLVGNITSSQITGCSGNMNVNVTGDVTATRFSNNGPITANVSGTKLYTIVTPSDGEIVNIVHNFAINSTNTTSSYTITTDGFYYAAFAGATYWLYSYDNNGNRQTTIIKNTEHPDTGTGYVSVNGNTITATRNAIDGNFIVRKF